LAPTEKAKEVIAEYLSNDPLVGSGEDGCYRLFASKTEDYIFEYFHNLGASNLLEKLGCTRIVKKVYLFFRSSFINGK
jgi:hypothetical protein